MKVKVKTASFLVSAATERQCPAPAAPEVAFAGRSNVGKSSLVNTLLGRKALVRVSSTPGRTRTLNFVDVSLAEGRPVRQLRMVDLPGYGYAKVSRVERKRWGPMVESYVTKRDSLALVVLVVDARRPPTELDLQMAHWLNELGRPWLCVATKLDKLPKSKRVGGLRETEKVLSLPARSVVGFSAEDSTGREALWGHVLDACEAAQ